MLCPPTWRSLGVSSTALRRTMAGMRKITAESSCVGCEGIGAALSAEQVDGYKPLIPDWTTDALHTRLSKKLRVRNFKVRAQCCVAAPATPFCMQTARARKGEAGG
jgi:hypothetical protein